MTGTTNGKAWSGGLVGAIVVLLMTLLAQATGYVSMPDATTIEMAVLYLIEAGVTFLVTYAGVWFKENFPRTPGQPDRFMSHWLAPLLFVVMLPLLAACPAHRPAALTDHPVMTARDVCETYDGTLQVLGTLRAGGQLDREQADQVNAIEEWATPLCTGEPPTDGATLAELERKLDELLLIQLEAEANE